MAEAKFLSAVSVLVNTKSISSDSDGGAASSIERLRESAIYRDDGRSLAWGLNFGWKSHDRSHAFVITSALVVRGLWQISQAIPSVAESARELIEPALAWLSSDSVLREIDGHRLPIYGDSDHNIVNNVVAQWSRALREAGGDSGEIQQLALQGARHIASKFIEGVGWQYSEDNNIVDLVHTAYIAEGLLPFRSELSSEVDLQISEALMVFKDGFTWADTCRVFTSRDALRSVPPTAATRTRITGRYSLVGFQAPARDWSVGALLSVACDLAHSELSPFWVAQAKAISQLALTRFAQAPYPRHAMHGAEGLAKYAILANKSNAVVAPKSFGG